MEYYYCYILPAMGKAKKVEPKHVINKPVKRERRIFNFVTEAIEYLEESLDMRVETRGRLYYLDGESGDLYPEKALIELAQDCWDQEN